LSKNKKQPKACSSCGKEFTPINKAQNTCVPCLRKLKEQEAALLLETKAKEEKLKQALRQKTKPTSPLGAKPDPPLEATTPGAKICRECKQEFMPGRSDQVRCDSCIAKIKDKTEHTSDNYKKVNLRCQNPNCPLPDRVFETTWEKYRKNQQYCSKDCWREHVKLRSKKYKEELEEKRRGNIPTQVVKIEYIPHDGGQREFHEYENIRFRVLACGARWGKDRASIASFCKNFAEMLSESRPKFLIPKVHGWLLAPNFPMARQLWRELKEFWPKEWTLRKNESDHQLETVGDGLIEVKSSDNWDHLVAVGLDALVHTEFARVRDQEGVFSMLRGRLASPGRGPGGKGGIAIFNSTPRGRDFFYKMFLWGGDPNFPDWKSFQYPTETNPYILPGEVEAAKMTMPERLFRQEFLAEFLSDSGEIFINVDDVSIGIIQNPERNLAYYAAWDPAQRNDWSAFGIRNERGEQVLKERWTGLPWTSQLDRVEYLCKRYNNAPLSIDSTGIGETLPEAACQRGVEATGHFFSNALKEQMVTHLSLLMERRDVILLDDKDQKEELKSYTYDITKTGKISYHAIQGTHDDLVSMLLLLYKDFQSPVLVLPWMGLLTGIQKRPSLLHA